MTRATGARLYSWASTDEAKVIESFLDSPGHCEILMDPVI